jgi:hypothetical protein
MGALLCDGNRQRQHAAAMSPASDLAASWAGRLPRCNAVTGRAESRRVRR